MHDLETAIIKTLCYFDIFRYPLTDFEVHKWLWENKASLIDVQAKLHQLAEGGKITHKDGLYFLPGNEVYIFERRKKYLQADKKYKKLKRIISLLQAVPFIRFVGACNTMHILDFKDTSDLDVFIIVEKNRMWTARLLTTILTALIGQWRHGTRIKDKVCLSFYVTTSELNLKSITLKEDPYLVYWISFVVPLLDRDTYSKFWNENKWIQRHIPNSIPQKSIARRMMKRSSFLDGIRYGLERMLAKSFGRHVEKFMKRIQIQKMQQKESEPGREKSAIVITDTMLKFHEIDRKRIYREEWREKIKNTL